jgi:hypothetical protein
MVKRALKRTLIQTVGPDGVVVTVLDRKTITKGSLSEPGLIPPTKAAPERTPPHDTMKKESAQ